MILDIFSSFDPTINKLHIFTIPALLIISLSAIYLTQPFWLHLFPSLHPLSLFISVINDQRSRTIGKIMKGLSGIIVTLFSMFILLNLSGLIPYFFSFSRHLIVTIRLGLPLWMSLVISSFSYNTAYALASLLPRGAPDWLNPFLVLIETTRILVRPLTLSFRLAANITAGHVVLGLIGSYTVYSLIIRPFWASLLIILVEAGYILFEVAICIIQAYIFCLLLTLYSDEHSHN